MGARFVDDIPEAPGDLQLLINPHQQFLTLQWTNPTSTVQGNPLDTLATIRIWRNGELIAVVGNDTCFFNDQLPRPDYYRYAICAEDTSGRAGRLLYTAEMWLGGSISGILIWELDPTPLTGDALRTELGAMGYSNHVYLSPLSHRYPLDSNLDAVFVCLGIYPNNHVLTESEGEMLRQYLTAGGRLYMEGGDTWYYDPPTPVHSYFRINPVGDGSNDLSAVVGQAGTPFAGYQFAYAGENNYIDEIEQTEYSLKILFNPLDTRGTAVVCLGDGYRTIGTSFEFGGLVDGIVPSTKLNLLRSYLEFFGMITTGIASGATEELPSAIALYQNYPNPFNPRTVIVFDLPAAAQVTLQIINILGEEVSTLHSGQMPPGRYRYEWNAVDFASGMYLCRLEVGGQMLMRKMILLK